MRFVGGKDGQVFVVDRGVACIGEFEWGTMSQSAAELAKALVHRATKSQIKATNLHRRYLHREVSRWGKGQAWSKTDQDVLDVLREIEAVQESVHVPRAITPPPAPPNMGGGLALDPRLSGYGGNDSAPDRRRR